MKPALILLAAGRGSRFHGNKLLYCLDGKPMYQHIADQISRLPEDFFCQKLVVTCYEEIGQALEKRGYGFVRNTDSSLGISHSIRLGLLEHKKRMEEAKCVWEETPVCFSVCDQPYLTAESLRHLVEGCQKSGKGIGALSYRQEAGNPVLFSGKYIGELLLLTGDTGGKRLLKRYPEDVWFCEALEEEELMDVDVKPTNVKN